jgi:hypothetical protein
VCWFLGFTPQHDYRLFEARASADELLPSEDDETLFELELEERDFALRVRPGLVRLVGNALQQPGSPKRATVGELLRLEVSALVVEVDESSMVDLVLVVHLPVVVAGARVPPDWPGPLLLQRLAELATGQEAAMLELVYPERLPVPDGDRPLDPSAELAIAVHNWIL